MTQSEPTPKREVPGVDAHLARHGKVSYLEIPAVDVSRSAAFYEAVFGWSVRRQDDARHADRAGFDDAAHDLIGALVTGLEPSNDAGFLPYIYVEGIDAALERVVEQGGEVVAPVAPEGNLWIARFRDPAGNLLGVWQGGER
ncbi:MAG: VOC family protein [Dehalococcoidia bacterium]|nr:VOC family protein [Dehalococcoidia bacterium]